MELQKKTSVRKCAAFGCPVTSEKYPHIKLFNFPRQHEGKLIRYKEWVKFSNNPNLTSGKIKSASLCSKHFTTKQFKSPKRDVLHSNAVPNIPFIKFLKHKRIRKSVAMKVNSDASDPQGYNEQNKIAAFNEDTYMTFSHNLFFKEQNPNESTHGVHERSILSIEDDCTNLAVNTLSQLFGKPPDITSQAPFHKWIAFAKDQNIICDQVEYALCTAKNLNDFMSSNSPPENDEAFYGFPSEDDSNFALLDLQSSKLL